MLQQKVAESKATPKPSSKKSKRRASVDVKVNVFARSSSYCMLTPALIEVWVLCLIALQEMEGEEVEALGHQGHV